MQSRIVLLLFSLTLAFPVLAHAADGGEGEVTIIPITGMVARKNGTVSHFYWGNYRKLYRNTEYASKDGRTIPWDYLRTFCSLRGVPEEKCLESLRFLPAKAVWKFPRPKRDMKTEKAFALFRDGKPTMEDAIVMEPSAGVMEYDRKKGFHTFTPGIPKRQFTIAQEANAPVPVTDRTPIMYPAVKPAVFIIEEGEEIMHQLPPIVQASFLPGVTDELGWYILTGIGWPLDLFLAGLAAFLVFAGYLLSRGDPWLERFADEVRTDMEAAPAKFPGNIAKLKPKENQGP